MANDINDTQYTTEPIVKLEVAKLASYHDVSGLGDYRVVEFERRLIWIRQTRAVLEYWRNGKRLAERSTRAWGSSYLSVFESSILEAINACREEEIDESSDIELVIRLIITDVPAVTCNAFANGVASEKIGYRPIPETWKSNHHLAYQGDGELHKWARAKGVERSELVEEVQWICPAEVMDLIAWRSSKHLTASGAREVEAFIEHLRSDITPLNGDLIKARKHAAFLAVGTNV
ncbi:hypothetical protein HNP46_005814 [Pseudomonas nitritireducens]|uniref:Uncharacterized protein n=1 Tax=Pseudomonas nitroreducens TaxID=46680 RepID=A0A7W7KQ38_PSENT|nr:hypothetical protein [Pseudomonas nitritireducens]MBB4866907.1 hypothetical protein [Pseudomonas nitritireducens]